VILLRAINALCSVIHTVLVLCPLYRMVWGINIQETPVLTYLAGSYILLLLDVFGGKCYLPLIVFLSASKDMMRRNFFLGQQANALCRQVVVGSYLLSALSSIRTRYYASTSEEALHPFDIGN
jgi:hypothetical protein